MSVVLPAEGDAILLAGDEAMVGDGDAVCVAGEIGEDMLGSAEGRPGVDDPLVRIELVQELAEALGLGQFLKGTVELQLAVDNELLESSDELGAEDAAENSDGQEET